VPAKVVTISATMARRKKRKTKQRIRRWGRRLGFAVLGFVLLSFLLVLPLRWFNPITTASMLQDDTGRDVQRFADHFGLDFTAIRKAVDEKNARGSLRGASTISQQTAKNLFLWPGRNFVRKGLEAWLTVVVEIYLNVAEFGPGTYGIGAAALLAAVLPSPRRLRVTSPSGYVRERQRWILGQISRLRREGWITRLA
jgi:monofunctional biosynthetic peptidoglycan transglycosylase